MKKLMKTPKLIIGAFLVALLIMVSVALGSGPATATPAHADGDDVKVQVEVQAYEFSAYYGGPTSMGITWSGFD